MTLSLIKRLKDDIILSGKIFLEKRSYKDDFIGRKALEKEMSNPQKMIVSLIWNPEDILDVHT